MTDKSRSIAPVIFLILVSLFFNPAGFGGFSAAVDVSDGTLSDWVNVTVSFNDPLGDSPIDMTDLVFVAFDFDDTWLYVRWDIDNDGTKPAVLYDMGINITASGITWDIFVAAQIERISGTPVLTNISIRDAADTHIWNASDDGSMVEDGTLYFDPPPGGTPGTISVEARFPLSPIASTTGLIFSQFRSHSSIQVTSNVKDVVPDTGYIILSLDDDPPELANLSDTPDPQVAGGNINITVDVIDDYNVESVWVNVTFPDSSWANVSMFPGGGDEWFLNTTYLDPGLYSYTVWANDSSDNWNSTGPGTFTITGDQSLPELSNLLDFPDPQIPGGNVNITVDVTDNIGVSSVWVNITFPDATWNNVTMTKGSGDGWYYNTSYSDLGSYSYIVWANDSSNNWNSTGPGAFTIQDIDGPQFSNLDDNPDPQENDGYVNVTVDVTDNVAVSMVWINVTYPDATWTNVSMIQGTGDEWFYNTSYADLGAYTYTIFANDTNDNWNTAGPGTFTIQDTDGPLLNNLGDVPDPQENGGNVNITVDVIDDVGVDSVWVNISYPNGTLTNVSMNKGSGNEWFYEASYSDLGVYFYTVWANDTSDNRATTGPGTFTIQDTDGPVFSNLDDAPDPQENDGYVNITVDVTDDVGVDGVWINITYPDATWLNVSMAPGAGDEWFYNTTYADLGSYSYTVWANDTSSNWNFSGPGTFIIQDTDGPFLANLNDIPDPQEYNGFVNINVDVTDDVGVDEVWINITYPDATWINISMIPGVGDEWFYNTTYTDLGIHSYSVWAKDTSSNWNSSGPGTFTIQDTKGPLFEGLVDAPDPQEIGGFVNISVNVTDPVGVGGVWINITYPNGSWLNISMLPGSGDGWYYNSTFIDQGTYSYTVWANDTSSNWNNSNPGGFEIKGDTSPPVLSNLNDFPDPQVPGGLVNITVDVTDDIAVDEVWVNITYPDGSTVNVSMTKGSGNEWFHDTSYMDSGIYSYIVWANDTSNNWNSAGPGAFGIFDSIDPELSNLDATPNPQENDGYVNITVDITDDVGVDEVWVNITYPDSSWINVTMTQGAGNEWFYNSTYPDLGDYSYTVWANDTSSNWNSTGPRIFTIQDTDGPILTNLIDTPDPQENGGFVNITVDVIDDVGVDGVWVNITYPDSSWINVSMEKGIGDEWFYNNSLLDLGIHSYTVWAKDTSSNWNKTGPGTFTIQDTDGPIFNNILDFPDPQENNGVVNITVDVTDDVGVDEVWVNITYPNGSWFNVSMDKGLGDGWFYTTIYSDLGTYLYTIYANDTSNNLNSTSPESFLVEDTDGPEFNNLDDTPDPQEINGSVNITVEIIDDVAIDEVLINLTYPNGTWINVSMEPGSGSGWYYNSSYTDLGAYVYRIWASDTSGNWNTSGPGAFDIKIDIVPPIVWNGSDFPDPQVFGGFVNITVNATDNMGVDSVWINFTNPIGMQYNATMAQGTGNEWHYNTAYFVVGVYSYTIWVNDTSDNKMVFGPETFTIIDMIRPEFNNILDFPDPQENDGFVNITVDVIDDVAISEVLINITYPDSSWINISMAKGTGFGWYHDTSYIDLGIYSYQIWAYDTSYNWNTTGSYSFVIRDTDGPLIWDEKSDPNPQEIGGFVNISVKVIDDIAVDEVFVVIPYPDGGLLNTSMNKGAGDEWFYNISYPDEGIYFFSILAKDTSSNWNSTVPGTFEITKLDIPPILWNLTDYPDPQVVGGFVNITLNVKDYDGVDEVWLNLVYPNNIWVNTSTVPGSGYNWYYENSYFIPGVSSYRIWAKDKSGQWNATDLGMFTIIDIISPWFNDLVDTPDPQENEGYVNISVDVLDDVAVDSVWINLRYPNGTWVNKSLSHFRGDGWYLREPYTDLGLYIYAIFACDTSGNWNNTSSGSFIIQDTDGPDIKIPKEKPNRFNIDDMINITVGVFDDVGIGGVWINLTLADGTWTNVTMEKGSHNQWYYNIDSDFLGDYTYTIWAVDTSGNWNSSGPETFSIEPEEDPGEPSRVPNIFLLIIFWPLLLILFTILLVRRYGFKNRLKKDTDCIISVINDFKTSNPKIHPMDVTRIQDIVLLSIRTGIPFEEFILAYLESENAFKIEEVLPNFGGKDI
ncbi:MAG: hypothetical protein JSW00_18650 [Thermoplasmata archaeon]|nr:MAG: hypothetical protein JSW00_18650 [Thermoplasmata archaeon]